MDPLSMYSSGLRVTPRTPIVLLLAKTLHHLSPGPLQAKPDYANDHANRQPVRVTSAAQLGPTDL